MQGQNFYTAAKMITSKKPSQNYSNQALISEKSTYYILIKYIFNQNIR